MNFIMKCMKFIETFGENSRRETSLLIINALWSRISTQFRDFLLSRPRPGVAGPAEHLGIGGIFSTVVVDRRPIHLYLIFKKSSWKNQVRQTEFLVYFELDFYCLCSLQKSISKLIFAG